MFFSSFAVFVCFRQGSESTLSVKRPAPESANASDPKRQRIGAAASSPSGTSYLSLFVCFLLMSLVLDGCLLSHFLLLSPSFFALFSSFAGEKFLIL